MRRREPRRPATLRGRVASAALALAAAAGALTPIAGQEFCPAGREIRLGPALIRDDQGDLGLGVEGALAACRSQQQFRASFARSTFVSASLAGQLSFAELTTPRQLIASGAFGLTMTLAKVNPSDDIDADFYLFHYGFLGLGASAHYEASADLDEQAFAGAAELRYVDPTRWLLPSLVLSGEWVKPTESEARDSLSLDTSSFGRFQARAYWLIPVTSTVRAELDAALFRTSGLPALLRSAGWSSGEWLTATASYLPNLRLGAILIETVFLQFAAGQTPTVASDRKAWTIGLQLGG